MSQDRAELLQDLPEIAEVCERPGVSGLVDLHGRPVVIHAVKLVLETAKKRVMLDESPPSRAELADLLSNEVIAAAVAGRLRPGLRRMINATGVILHSNLGRAPLAPEAVAAVASAGGGYACLEVDVNTGGKACRERHVAGLLTDMLGSEAATVVNNGAAAALISLQSTAARGEVLVSRGEMVELGGGGRVAEMACGIGCSLVPVGSAQRATVSDYRESFGPKTTAILKIQRSSYDVAGFSEAASIGELAELAREKGVPLIHDIGSGMLSTDLAAGILHGEVTPERSLGEGSSLVCFSGDKLLGGPQCGVVAGRRPLVEAVARHPMMRALRCDKLTLAALEATLRLYRDGRLDAVPVAQMLRATAEELEVRARAVIVHLARRRIGARTVECIDAIGGGTAPYAGIPGVAVEVEHKRATRLAARLRTGDPAVLTGMHGGSIQLHMRTVGEYEADALAAAVERAARN